MGCEVQAWLDAMARGGAGGGVTAGRRRGAVIVVLMGSILGETGGWKESCDEAGGLTGVELR